MPLQLNTNVAHDNCVYFIIHSTCPFSNVMIAPLINYFSRVANMYHGKHTRAIGKNRFYIDDSVNWTIFQQLQIMAIRILIYFLWRFLSWCLSFSFYILKKSQIWCIFSSLQWITHKQTPHTHTQVHSIQMQWAAPICHNHVDCTDLSTFSMMLAMQISILILIRFFPDAFHFWWQMMKFIFHWNN